MIFFRSARAGVFASVGILAVYASVLLLLSGLSGLQYQLSQYWYYILSLAVGFGVQMGMYVYLRGIAASLSRKGVLAVSGATSTAAMVSCCTHYLANIIPIIGATGIVALVSQYQVELFWIGLFSNVLGIAYIGRKIILFKRTLKYET